MTDRIAELRALLARLQTDENPFAQFEALLVAEANLPALLDCASALRDLLQDTQHAEHECDDEVFCPVKNGHAALRALNGDDMTDRYQEIRDALMAEALEKIRSRSSMNLAMQPDPFELTARLGDIYQIADAALSKENSNDRPLPTPARCDCCAWSCRMALARPWRSPRCGAHDHRTVRRHRMVR